MRKTVLSRRQQGILRFLYCYSQDKVFYPTIREICEGTQTISRSVVKHYLEQLVEMGYLNHSPRRSRSSTLSQKAYELLQVSPNGELRPDVHNALEQEVRQLGPAY
jgi:SOS-response transcriptional repressor LexA